MAPPSPDPGVAAARRRAFDDGATTTHWPTRVVRSDEYDSFKALSDEVRLRFLAAAPRAERTAAVEGLL